MTSTFTGGSLPVAPAETIGPTAGTSGSTSIVGLRGPVDVSDIRGGSADWSIGSDTARLQAALLDSVGQAVIATDVDGIVIYWNPAAERLYGWTPQEAAGRSIVDLTPSPQTVEEATRIFAELAAGRSWAGSSSRATATALPSRST